MGMPGIPALWNAGTNSITLSTDESKLYLVVIATPKPMGIVRSLWSVMTRDAGLQFPYKVSFTNATPTNIIYPAQSHTGVCTSTRMVGLGIQLGNSRLDRLRRPERSGSGHRADQEQRQDRRLCAVVMNSAQVRDNAIVSGHAIVQDAAQVYGNAKVRDWAIVGGDALIYENAMVLEHAIVQDTNNIDAR